MKVAKFARTFALVAPVLALAACDEDPAAVGSGNPFAIVTNFSVVNAAVGDDITLTAQIVDRGGTTLPIEVNVTSTAQNFVVDSTRFVRELQFTRIYGKTTEVGTKIGVVVTGGGLTDTITVNVTSGPFPGTVSVETINGMRTLVFASTGGLFDADAELGVETDDPGYLKIVSANRAEYILPYGQAAGNLRYSVANAGPDQFELTGTYAMAEGTPMMDPHEPNNSPATSSSALVPDGTPLYGSVSGADADDFYTLTVTEAGVYDVVLDWTDHADLDVYVTNAAGTLRACSDDFVGCAMATGANPERGVTRELAPGTYRIYVSLYEGDGPTTTYRLTVTRR